MNTQNLKHDQDRPEPANEEIAALAYSYFEATGRVNGHDLAHWLRAKHQLAKAGSSENRPQSDVKAVNRLTNDDAGKQTPVVRARRSRGKDRYGQVSTAR